MEIALSIFIEIVLALASLGASATMQNQAEDRSSRETWVRGLVDTFKDKYNLTMTQIDQALSKLDLTLSQLTDTTRGSARLSRAKQIAREFIAAYPEEQARLHKIRNEVQAEINNLNSKEQEYASRIQQRGQVSNSEVTRDLYDSAVGVNKAITSTEGAVDRSNLINTSTIENEVKKKEPTSWTTTLKPIQWTGGYH